MGIDIGSQDSDENGFIYPPELKQYILFPDFEELEMPVKFNPDIRGYWKSRTGGIVRFWKEASDITKRIMLTPPIICIIITVFAFLAGQAGVFKDGGLVAVVSSATGIISGATIGGSFFAWNVMTEYIEYIKPDSTEEGSVAAVNRKKVVEPWIKKYGEKLFQKIDKNSNVSYSEKEELAKYHTKVMMCISTIAENNLKPINYEQNTNFEEANTKIIELRLSFEKEEKLYLLRKIRQKVLREQSDQIAYAKWVGKEWEEICKEDNQYLVEEPKITTKNYIQTHIKEKVEFILGEGDQANEWIKYISDSSLEEREIRKNNKKMNVMAWVEEIIENEQKIIILEGQSGIGKTTTVQKIVLQGLEGGFSKNVSIEWIEAKKFNREEYSKELLENFDKEIFQCFRSESWDSNSENTEKRLLIIDGLDENNYRDFEKALLDHLRDFSSAYNASIIMTSRPTNNYGNLFEKSTLLPLTNNDAVKIQMSRLATRNIKDKKISSWIQKNLPSEILMYPMALMIISDIIEKIPETGISDQDLSAHRVSKSIIHHIHKINRNKTIDTKNLIETISQWIRDKKLEIKKSELNLDDGHLALARELHIIDSNSVLQDEAFFLVNGEINEVNWKNILEENKRDEDMLKMIFQHFLTTDYPHEQLERSLFNEKQTAILFDAAAQQWNLAGLIGKKKILSRLGITPNDDGRMDEKFMIEDGYISNQNRLIDIISLLHLHCTTYSEDCIIEEWRSRHYIDNIWIELSMKLVDFLNQSEFNTDEIVSKIDDSMVQAYGLEGRDIKEEVSQQIDFINTGKIPLKGHGLFIGYETLKLIWPETIINQYEGSNLIPHNQKTMKKYVENRMLTTIPGSMLKLLSRLFESFNETYANKEDWDEIDDIDYEKLSLSLQDDFKILIYLEFIDIQFRYRFGGKGPLFKCKYDGELAQLFLDNRGYFLDEKSILLEIIFDRIDGINFPKAAALPLIYHKLRGSYKKPQNPLRQFQGADFWIPRPEGRVSHVPLYWKESDETITTTDSITGETITENLKIITRDSENILNQVPGTGESNDRYPFETPDHLKTRWPSVDPVEMKLVALDQLKPSQKSWSKQIGYRLIENCPECNKYPIVKGDYRICDQDFDGGKCRAIVNYSRKKYAPFNLIGTKKGVQVYFPSKRIGRYSTQLISFHSQIFRDKSYLFPMKKEIEERGLTQEVNTRVETYTDEDYITNTVKLFRPRLLVDEKWFNREPFLVCLCLVDYLEGIVLWAVPLDDTSSKTAILLDGRLDSIDYPNGFATPKEYKKLGREYTFTIKEGGKFLEYQEMIEGLESEKIVFPTPYYRAYVRENGWCLIPGFPPRTEIQIEEYSGEQMQWIAISFDLKESKKKYHNLISKDILSLCQTCLMPNDESNNQCTCDNNLSAKVEH